MNRALNACQQALSGFRQADTARCALAQCDTALIFQFPNTLADSRTGHAKTLGGRTKIRLIGDSEKNPQQIEIYLCQAVLTNPVINGGIPRTLLLV